MAKKWIQKASREMERKGTKGLLHEKLHVKQGEKIPESKLKAAEAKGGKLAKEAQFAENVRKGK